MSDTNIPNTANTAIETPQSLLDQINKLFRRPQDVEQAQTALAAMHGTYATQEAYVELLQPDKNAVNTGNMVIENLLYYIQLHVEEETARMYQNAMSNQ